MTTHWLVLLRHAKAATPSGIPDRERPLTRRGHADAAAAGVWLSCRYSPDLVLCSPAQRTRQTWLAVVGTLGCGPQALFPDVAYAAGATELLDLVRETRNSIETVLLIGHNPAVSQLSALLDPAGADPEGLRTCGLAVHAVAGAWADLAPGQASLRAAHTARASPERGDPAR